MSTEYSFHEVANLFPMMDDEAFAELCEDISSNGLIEPIWLYDGQIIDGRNRYRACLKTETVPLFRTWDGKGNLVAFVCSLNLKRRHLTSSQKAAVALEMLPLLEAEAKKKQRAHGGTAPGKAKETLLEEIPEVSETAKTSVEVAAEMLGTNPRYVQDMKIIAKEAPEKVQEIRDGKVSVPKVMNDLRPKTPAASKNQTKEVKAEKGMDANQLAEIAIRHLEMMRADDPQRISALQSVRQWISTELMPKNEYPIFQDYEEITFG